MASEEDKKQEKKPETVRERAERAIQESSKPSKRTDESKVDKPEKKTRKLRRNKADKKPRRFHIIPKYFRESFAELRQVTWPNRKETFKLTTAVILFSIVFAALISVVDSGFSLIFKKVFLHG